MAQKKMNSYYIFLYASTHSLKYRVQPYNEQDGNRNEGRAKGKQSLYK